MGGKGGEKNTHKTVTSKYSNLLVTSLLNLKFLNF